MLARTHTMADGMDGAGYWLYRPLREVRRLMSSTVEAAPMRLTAKLKARMGASKWKGMTSPR